MEQIPGPDPEVLKNHYLDFGHPSSESGRDAGPDDPIFQKLPYIPPPPPERSAWARFNGSAGCTVILSILAILYGVFLFTNGRLLGALMNFVLAGVTIWLSFITIRLWIRRRRN